MTLQSSGQISYSDIINEFGSSGNGGLGAYRVSENIGSLSNMPLDSGVPQSGAIAFNDFYSKKLNVVVDFHSGGTEYRQNAKNKYTANGVRVIGGFRTRPTNTSNIKVFVNVNKSIGSATNNATSRCALRTGTWDSNTTLQVDVGGSGKIYGAGGTGGRGSNGAGRGGDGGNGNSALGIEYNGTVVNVASGGYIQCGFEGGGGGGGGYSNPDKNPQDHLSTGGGGGGGAGLPIGQGGVKGDGTFGAGSDGSAGDDSTRTIGGDGGDGGSGRGSSGGNGGRGAGTTFGAQGGGGGGGNVNNSPGGDSGSRGAAIRETSGVGFTLNISGSGQVIGDANPANTAPGGVS